MTSDKIWHRSDFLGTQVITRDTGKRLGVVSQLWVDVDQREVVALGLRENLLSNLVSGVPRFMLLSSIRQIGDVILVDTEDAIEDVNVEVYNSLINCEVITETGEPLGRVRGFRFDVEDGKVTSLIIAQLGIPLIPDQIVSTYELPIEEIVSSGPDRLIVFEGAEERLNQLTVGVLERLGIGRPPWERDAEEDYIVPTVSASNQLGPGTRVPTAPPVRTRQPVVEETWNEDNWGEPAPKQMRQREPEPRYYQEEENWAGSEARGNERFDDDYDNDEYEEYEEEVYNERGYVDEAVEADVWDDEPRKPLKIPEKTKAPEYEEEGY